MRLKAAINDMVAIVPELIMIIDTCENDFYTFYNKIEAINSELDSTNPEA